MKEKDITKQTHLSLSEQIRILGEGGGKEEPCPICGGDGIAVCNNPDHGFIHGGLGDNELARLGCPCCGHDPEHKIKGEKCEYCNGVGKVKQPEPIEDYPVYSEEHAQEIGKEEFDINVKFPKGNTTHKGTLKSTKDKPMDMIRKAFEPIQKGQNMVKDQSGQGVESIKLKWQKHNRDNAMSWNEVAELVNEVASQVQAQVPTEEFIKWIIKNPYEFQQNFIDASFYNVVTMTRYTIKELYEYWINNIKNK